MKFVATKTADQLGLQPLHRIKTRHRYLRVLFVQAAWVALAYHRTRRIRPRHDPPLDLIAPSAATSRPDPDIHPSLRLRSANYIVNHICEPYCM